MKRKKAVNTLLGVLTLILAVSLVSCKTFKHLGCWMDTNANDLAMKKTTITDMNLDKCVNFCSTEGYAYAGMKRGTECSCDNDYGIHQPANTCNYTCSGVPCGGPDANDIYYTINTDITQRAKRRLYGYAKTEDFFESRRTCVKGDGDIVVMRDPSYFSQLQDVANSSGIVSEWVWIGLFFNTNNKFTWTDPSIQGLSSASVSPYWKTGESFSHNCVLLNLGGKYWRTESCKSKYPFICFQLPPVNENDGVTEAPEETEVVEDTSGGFLANNQVITFYVILPLFVFCYGGSCLAWAIAKCWRHVKRRKRQRAREDMMAQEFESDTKPLTGSTSTGSSRPLTSRDVKVEEGYTPPPPYYRVNSRASKTERPVHTPVQEFRPEDEEDKPPTKPRQASAGARPRSSRSPHMSELDPPAIPPPPMQSPKPPRRAENYKVQETGEPDIDYTKLSISDIMYIRGLMNSSNLGGEKKKRKKARKIIVS